MWREREGKGERGRKRKERRREEGQKMGEELCCRGSGRHAAAK